MIYDISYKTLIGSKPLWIRFNKIDGIIRIYGGTWYLTLFGSKKYDTIYNRIRYLISLKSGITYIFSHYLAKIKFDSYDSLLIEKVLTLHNVIILIKSALNKQKNHYYYKISLEKCSYQLAKNQKQIFVHSIIMLRFGEREMFYALKQPIKIWDVNVHNIVISKLVKTKINSNYLIGI